MKTGSIVFGPVQTKHQIDEFDWSKVRGHVFQDKKPSLEPFPCNCIGPQPGQTKCPCALRGELEMGRRMLVDGVTINGKRYRLVAEDDKGATQ